MRRARAFHHLAAFSVAAVLLAAPIVVFHGGGSLPIHGAAIARAEAADCAASANPFIAAACNFDALSEKNLPVRRGLDVIIGSFIQAAIALVGVLFFAYMVYGGFLWMTARGESDQVDKAKEVLKHATIGLAITLGAYAVTYYVITKLVEASGIAAPP